MPTWLPIVPALSALLDRLIPDPQARENAKLALMQADFAQEIERLRLALSADQAQTEINKAEAGHGSLFVAGWRPFIGWVCGAAFAYHFVLQPLLAFLIANTGGSAALPDFDMEELTTVLMGMLGLGGMRTIEKIRKAA